MLYNSKIIFFSNSSWNLYHFRNCLIKKLRKSNFIISVAPKDYFSKKLAKISNKYINYSLSQKKNFLLFLFNLINFFKIIKKEKPSIILSYTIKCNVITIIIAKILGIKSFINVTGLGSTFIKKNFFNKILQYIIRFLYKNHDYIIFQNTEDAKLIFGANPKKKSFFCLPGVGVDTSRYVRQTRNETKNQKTINFFMISRIIKDKGVLEYLNTAKIISKKFNNTKFNYVGDFDTENPSTIDKNIFYNLLRKSYVKYYRFNNDIRIYLKKADCIILPSYREGLSRVLLESASMQIPIITTNVPGCKDIVINNYNGFLCKPKSTNDLVKTVAKFILQSKRKRIKMGIKSRELILKKFNQKKIIEEYIALLNA